MAPERSKRKQKRRETGSENDELGRGFGLPPTPKVRLGAGFSTVFHGCPLRVNCTASWTNPESKDQHILIGAEEGLYTLNLSQLHEATMERLHPKRCTWLHVVKDVAMAVQGRTPHVYRHDLVPLHSRDLTQRLLAPKLNHKVPEKWLPRKLAMTTRIPETKGTLRACTMRNPYNGYAYMAVAVPTGVILLQWYDPLSKFLILKQVSVTESFLPLPKIFTSSVPSR